MREGIGIWDNESCANCGACCYQHNLAVYKTPCPNQRINEGKSSCLIHDKSKRQLGDLCEKFFCGTFDFLSRGGEDGVNELRQIAYKLGTAPKEYKIPR